MQLPMAVHTLDKALVWVYCSIMLPAQQLSPDLLIAVMTVTLQTALTLKMQGFSV